MDNPQTQVQLNEIGQIALTVGNLAEAKTFYQDVLGMRFLFDAGTMSFFQCGGVRLLIGASEERVGQGGTILYFRVTEIRQAHAALLANGVAFEPVSYTHLDVYKRQDKVPASSGNHGGN